jgi:hypothetical protein
METAHKGGGYYHGGMERHLAPEGRWIGRWSVGLILDWLGRSVEPLEMLLLLFTLGDEAALLVLSPPLGRDRARCVRVAWDRACVSWATLDGVAIAAFRKIEFLGCEILGVVG